MTNPNYPIAGIQQAAPVSGGLNSPETIIIGIGNSSRGDDGLGWEFLKRLEAWGQFRGAIEYRYLLLVEDAERISGFSNVIFVDARHGALEKGFAFEKAAACRSFEFTTHIIPPPSVLYLARELYESVPRAWTLAIAGEQWGLGKGLSEAGRINLDSAFEFFQNAIS